MCSVHSLFEFVCENRYWINKCAKVLLFKLLEIMATSLKTRKKTELWLIGYPIEQINSSKLPSIGDVLCRLFFITKNDKKSLREASSITCEEVCNIWEIANIPTRAKQHVITKIEKLYEQYRSLQKSKSKTTDSQNAKKLMFKECLQDLFDIAHVNAMEMIKYSEDK